MMGTQRLVRWSVIAWVTALIMFNASATTVAFSGNLDIVEGINPAAVYFGQQGVAFEGTIDDIDAFGQITDGTTLTDFTCCMAAGGASIVLNVPLDQGTIDLLDQLPNPPAVALNQLVDVVEIEGDATTGSDGRIEIGLSYIFPSGGAGIPAFFTATGVGTTIADGKETRDIEGRTYVMETWLKADLSLVKADTADKSGNLVFSKTARNFNPMMAQAGAITIVEVDNLVEVGLHRPVPSWG